MEESWVLRGSMQPIKFSGEYITLDIRENSSVPANSWMITPESTPLKVLLYTTYSYKNYDQI